MEISYVVFATLPTIRIDGITGYGDRLHKWLCDRNACAIDPRKVCIWNLTPYSVDEFGTLLSEFVESVTGEASSCDRVSYRRFDQMGDGNLRGLEITWEGWGWQVQLVDEDWKVCIGELDRRNREVRQGIAPADDSINYLPNDAKPIEEFFDAE